MELGGKKKQKPKSEFARFKTNSKATHVHFEQLVQFWLVKTKYSTRNPNYETKETSTKTGSLYTKHKITTLTMKLNQTNPRINISAKPNKTNPTHWGKTDLSLGAWAATLAAFCRKASPFGR